MVVQKSVVGGCTNKLCGGALTSRVVVHQDSLLLSLGSHTQHVTAACLAGLMHLIHRPLCPTQRLCACHSTLQRDGTLRSEIVAHSRWLSAMDIHPARDIVATVSEDCTLGVWTLPLSGQQVCCSCPAAAQYHNYTMLPLLLLLLLVTPGHPHTSCLTYLPLPSCDHMVTWGSSAPP